MNCGPGSRQLRTNSSRTTFGGRPNRRASPAQTPPIQRPRVGRTSEEAISLIPFTIGRVTQVSRAEQAGNVDLDVEPGPRQGPTRVLPEPLRAEPQPARRKPRPRRLVLFFLGPGPP